MTKIEEVLLISNMSYHFRRVSMVLMMLVLIACVQLKRKEAKVGTDFPKTASSSSNSSSTPPLRSITTTNKASSSRLCYDMATSRSASLPGSWVQKDNDNKPAYGNLSCPVEWSKYSCSYHGATEHAEEAATWKFQPQSCELPELASGGDALYAALAGRKILFLGNSLLRQVMISWSCALHSSGRISNPAEDMRVDWAKCGEKEWPCSIVTAMDKCIKCGPHSGGLGMRIKAQAQKQKGSGEKESFFEFIHDGSKNVTNVTEPLSEKDVVIVQAANNRIDAMLELLLSTIPKHSWPTIIHMIPWSPQFKTKDGSYDTKVLAASRKERKEMLIYTTGCLAKVNANLPKNQFEALPKQFGEHPILWLNGTNSLGKAKVGGTYGTYGDCQHFCMPGPSDQIARALEWLVFQTLLSGRASPS